MKLLRKKYLIKVTIMATMISLINISIHLNKIIEVFPKNVISTLLLEEENESAEDLSKDNPETLIDIIFLSRPSILIYSIQTNKTSLVDFIQLPSKPFFEMLTPPPQG